MEQELCLPLPHRETTLCPSRRSKGFLIELRVQRPGNPRAERLQMRRDQTAMNRMPATRSRNTKRSKSPKFRYETTRGRMFEGTVEELLDSAIGRGLRGKVQLIFTSPPYPLNRKKKYGNLNGTDYIQWLSALAPRLSQVLKPNGSLVIELGNSWTPGSPTMSTLALEALLAFKSAGNFHLCQQFACHNPARLPSPVQWVNRERIRVKDAYTHLWWMSPSERPMADNRRVLTEYSPSMRRLLKSGQYNNGRRPSQHLIGESSFLTNNGGAIPSNVLTVSNTSSRDAYLRYCRDRCIDPHPARMASQLPEFFIRFLTNPRHLVFDPFSGSNCTGAAAESLKRRWIGVEPNAAYIDGSIGRFGECLTKGKRNCAR